MKIGIDIRNVGKKRTGDETVFLNYVKNLALIDNENEYFLFTDMTDIDFLNGIKTSLGIENKKNFKIVSLRSKNKFGWNFWTLPRYLKKNSVDVYHTQYILPFFISKKIKLITTIHDISFNFYPQFIKFTDLFFLKVLIPWSLRRADKIIAVSEFTRNEIIKYYKIAPEKVIVAYNGMRIADYESAHTNQEISAVKERYNLPEKFILYLGTMQPRKNIETLISAYFMVRKSFPAVRLVLVGNKNAHNFDKKIESAVRNNDSERDVIFTGYIDDEDKSELYKLAEIFISPSFYEGFGLPILEAMSAGVPVIASNIEPHKEIAGDAALYFDPKNAQELSEKIKEIISNNELRSNLTQQGLGQAKKFSWINTAEKLKQIYSNLSVD